MTTERVAVDMDREFAARIIAHTKGALFMDPQEFLVLAELAQDALDRKHNYADMTGYCSRCGADREQVVNDEEDGLCSGGAQ